MTHLPRLLIVTTAPITLNFLAPYADHFRRSGWSVDAATGSGDVVPWLSHFDRIWQVPWSRHVTDRKTWQTAPNAFRRILKSGHYDLVHVHTPIASFVGRLVIATTPRRPAVVYTAHGFHFHSDGRRSTNIAYLLAERIAGRYTDHLVVMNDEDHEAALRHRIVPAERLHKFPGIGLDLGIYAPDPELVAASYTWTRTLGIDDGHLFTVIAELQPGKDHLTAIRALAVSADRTMHLAFAGKGPMQEQLEGEARSLDVLDRVHFLGFVADVRPLILASTATVLPSRREGLPRAVLESLALGVPVIGARTRGITDLIHAAGGRLVAPGDVKGFARALEAAAQRRIPRAAKAAMVPFGIDNLIALHEQIYTEALRTSSASSTGAPDVMTRATRRMRRAALREASVCRPRGACGRRSLAAAMRQRTRPGWRSRRVRLYPRVRRGR